MSKRFLIFVTSSFLLLSTGCGPQLGGGSSMVSGSAGGKGAIGESSHLQKCNKRLGTVALNFNEREYHSWYYRYKLPRSPVPLVKLMLQQSGCFKVVSRGRGLKAAKDEIGLAEQGYIAKNQKISRGQVKAADYTVTPHIVFSEDNAGGIQGALTSTFGKWGNWAGRAVGNVKFKEAQVMLELVNNRTTEQEAAAEGSASQTDLGGSAGFFRGFGASLGGWQNTNEGKLIAAALLDSMNNLVQQVQ